MHDFDIAWLTQIDKDDSPFIGEHGVKLGELAKAGIPIPDGFIITSQAYDRFLKDNNLALKAKHILSTANFNDPNSLKQISSIIKKYFMEAEFASNFKLELYGAYKKLSGVLSDTHVRILHSPMILSNTFLFHENLDEIKGEASLINSIKEYWAANFSELNILNGFYDPGIIKSVIVQKSIDPEKSGKIYTVDPFENDKFKIIIKASHGLYEDQLNLVSMPDHYEIEKETHNLTSKVISPQTKMKKKSGIVKRVVDVPKALRNKQKLLASEIDELIKYAKLTEKLQYFPQEIDWSIAKGKIYFTHIRPVTSLS